MAKTTAVVGDYNIICARCGQKIKGSQVRLDGRLKGLPVCPECWDPPHPADRPTKPPRSEGTPPKIVNTPPADDTFVGSTTVDTYSSGNQDGTTTMYSGNNEQVGQSFTLSRGAVFSSVKVFMQKSGSPTGDAFVRLYKASSDVPTGSQLVNTQALDVSTLGTSSLSEVEFSLNDVQTRTLEDSDADTFTQSLVRLQREMPISSGDYAILVEYTGGDASNNVLIGHDGSSPTHDGKLFTTNTAGSSWSADSNKDLVFEITGDLADAIDTTPED